MIPTTMAEFRMDARDPCPICGTENGACTHQDAPAPGIGIVGQLAAHADAEYVSREQVYKDRPDMGPGVRELVYGIGTPIPFAEAVRQGIVPPDARDAKPLPGDSAPRATESVPSPPPAAVTAIEFPGPITVVGLRRR